MFNPAASHPIALDTGPGRFNPDVVPMLRLIGRGAHGSRSLEREQARTLMGWLLRRELSDAQLGAVLLSLRMKGESAEELEGFALAVRDAMPHMHVRTKRQVVVIPSANGARRLPNQVPLLASLLREQGMPVLVIDAPSAESGRLSTAPLWQELGMRIANSVEEAQHALEQNDAVLLPLSTLSPALDRLLQWRHVLGVRNGGHSVVKMLNPLQSPSLLVTAYTHPEYARLMQDVLLALRQPTLLMRGCEGEAVAHPNRDAERLGLHADGQVQTWPVGAPFTPPTDLPDGLDLRASAQWIHAILDGYRLPPEPLARQAACIRAMCESFAGSGAASARVRALGAATSPLTTSPRHVPTP
ncbi:DNA-binding protein YbiB [Thiomonas bhubaneswarensis]|uniref:Anthranilate phosphoribosyltransferase n=1 Tax=Thiomonas bhubaneswarensis TaxID=339866 RepID=A0A0K6I8S5_9BURK|nr:DNA-binding protein YbiB [Thiomonas bhubaneswarensis]CUA99501.1 Anthranilate phosphoribosyltransferase [Thiomonas bhubaneswarensis]